MKNNIHNLKPSAKHIAKDLHVIEATNKYIGNIKFEEIEKLLKSIPEIHRPIIEKAVQDRNYELLGVTIVMAISQVVQRNVKEGLYPWTTY